MEHQRYTELLPALVGGDLGPGERSRLEEHVERCDDCRQWVETYDSLARWFAQMEAAEAHPPSEALARLAVEPELLDPAERSELRDHLDGCVECRRHHDLALGAVGRARPPLRASFVERMVRVIEPRHRVAAAALLLVGLSALCVYAVRAWTTGGTVHLTDRSIVESSVFEARRNLLAAGVSVQTGAAVRLRAGDSVVLGEGFSVDSGAEMVVEVTARR